MQKAVTHLKRNPHKLWLLGIVIIAVILSRTLYAPCDDAYIFLVYAKNFIHGNGLTFNGTVVEGFSSPLWMGLLILFGWMRVPLPLLMQILSSLSGGFAIIATYILALRVLKDQHWALLPPILLIGSGDFVFYSGVGLEQVLFVGLVAISVAIFWDHPESRLKGWMLPILLALAILTRPEGGIFVFLVLLWGWIQTKSLRLSIQAGLKLTAILAPIMILKRLYYGYWLPNTFYVKSGNLMNLGLGKIYLIRNGLRYWPVVLLFGIFFLLLIWKKKFNTIKPLLPLLSMTAVWGAYVWVVGGDNLVGGRMLIPVLPLLFSSLVLMIKHALPKYGWALGIITLTAMFTLYGYTQDSFVSAHTERWRRNFPIRQAAGLYLKDNFPEDTLVALNPAGIIPYYSELPTIDMLGLNDAYISHYGNRDYSLDYGHQAGDGKYVLSRKPDVILFGGGVSRTPGDLVSDREIAQNSDFKTLYKKTTWPGIGTAYLRISAP